MACSFGQSYIGEYGACFEQTWVFSVGAKNLKVETTSGRRKGSFWGPVNQRPYVCGGTVPRCARVKNREEKRKRKGYKDKQKHR